MGKIQFLERGDLVRRKFERERRHRVIQMVQFGSAHDRRSHGRLVEQPRQCNLRRRPLPGRGKFVQAFHHKTIGGFRLAIK